MTEVAQKYKATYENFIATCPACGKENVFNRCTDLQTFEWISGKDVACFHCLSPFRIVGDSVVLPHKELFWESESYYDQKKYILSIIILGQSIEMFFFHATYQRLYWSFFENKLIETAEDAQVLYNNIDSFFKDYSFNHLRNIFLDIYLITKYSHILLNH